MELIRQVRREFRPAAKSLGAIIRWRRLSFDEAPPIFGNAKPKSGSHLLLQVLGGFTRIMPYRYVEAAPVRTITKAGSRRMQADILNDLRTLPAGVIGWGYVEATAENTGLLCAPGRVNYFIYRDPRDMLVSHVYFATDLYDEHGMHAYYRSLPDFDSRLEVAITGIDRDGMKMVSVRERYEGVLQWLKQPEVLCLRFEDFLERREATLASMLDQVERTGFHIPTPRAQALRILAEAIQPRRSRTFRAGRAGGWREHFTPKHKQLFLDVAGDLLVRLGYEPDNDW
ncbi:MAG TPA: sulfotransferase domain-containing protein [Anaerolineales bacterium]